MLRGGRSVRAIAKALGVAHLTVIRRIEKLGLDAEKKPASPTAGQHMDVYLRARRGFDVPRHLEAKYHELIRSGLPIAEVCQRLAIAVPKRRD